MDTIPSHDQTALSTVDHYTGLSAHWNRTRSDRLSALLAAGQDQLCHDTLVDELERLRTLAQAAEEAIRLVRFERLAIRQGEGYNADTEMSWREHAIDNPPLPGVIWDYIVQTLDHERMPTSDWQSKDWISSTAPPWVQELVGEAAAYCPSVPCYMRCSPNETRDLMERHGVSSFGDTLHDITTETGLT